MKLSQKVYLNLSHKQQKVVHELIWHVTKLYNIANYKLHENGYTPYNNEYDQVYKLNWHSDYLNSHNRQQLLRKLDSDWKSFFQSIKDYKKNSKQYTGKPNKPRFKNISNKPGEVIFTKAAFGQTLIRRKNQIMIF